MDLNKDSYKNELVGEILKMTREECDFTVEQIAEKTGIAKIQIENIEASNYECLPAAVYVNGFIEKYANILKIDADFLIKRFEKEFENFNLRTVNRKLPSLDKKFGFLSAKKIFFIFFAIIFAVVLIYFFKESLFVFRGPDIILLNPKNDEIVDSGVIDVVGKTDYGVEFLINGENVYIDKDGNFSHKLFLIAGLNKINISAKNNFGKISLINRNIIYRQPITENINEIMK